MRSIRPFPETFKSLRENLGLSERQVSARAAEHGAPSLSVMNRLYSGETPVFPHHLIAVAAALGISPETFAEYRLFQAQRLFDVVGDQRRSMDPLTFDQAMHNLEHFEDLMRIATDAALPPGKAAHDPAEIAAALEAAGAPSGQAAVERP